MLQPNGINHLALATSDMKGALEYFNDVLGMPLAALYWMHGAENTMHGFLTLNETSLLAFVYSPEIVDKVELGNTHAGTPVAPCAKGTMQHLALNVDTVDDLLTLRDRIRSRGIHCFGPMDHGLMTSIYFAGPDGITMEVATLSGEDPYKWIDPSTVEALGITPEQLETLKSPTPYERPAEPVANVPMEEANPLQLAFPAEAYEGMLKMTDEQFTEHTRDDVPPTEIDTTGRSFF